MRLGTDDLVAHLRGRQGIHFVVRNQKAASGQLAIEPGDHQVIVMLLCQEVDLTEDAAV